MSGRRSSKPDGNPDGSCGTAVAASIDAPRAISGVNTARGERPVSVASADSSRPIACAHARDVGDDGGKLGLGLAQVVFADDAAVETVALQRDGVGRGLLRLLEHRRQARRRRAAGNTRLATSAATVMRTVSR